VGCDEKDYKSEDFVPIVPGSPATRTAEAEAEARAGDGDGGVADEAASDSGEVVEEADVSQAEGQTRDEGSAAGKDLEPTAI
jgi:hypothetical protein